MIDPKFFQSSFQCLSLEVSDCELMYCNVLYHNNTKNTLGYLKDSNAAAHSVDTGIS